MRKRRPYHYLCDEIDIPLSVAVWVLFAHSVVVLSPLYLMWVVYQNWDYLLAHTHNPHFFYLAAGLFFCSSPFEVAQNTVDKWYLTEDSGSGNGVGFCDFLFWLFIISGMVALTVAAYGGNSWLVYIASSAIVIYPFLYLLDGIPYPALGLAGLPAAIAMYLAFGDPMMFFLLLSPAVLVYFLTALFITGNQSLHGFVTLAGGAGLIIATWLISYCAKNPVHGWFEFVACLVVLVVLGFIGRPAIKRLPKTQRRSEITIGGVNNE